MIKLFVVNIINVKEEIPFEITIFPDKTSQVWRMRNILRDVNTIGHFEIEWTFESEAEFLPLMQLAHLVRKSFPANDITLNMPYMVYGRQDKQVSNNTTFAQNTLLLLLGSCEIFTKIKTTDIHSDIITQHYGKFFENVDPSARIREVMDITNSDLVCFPDKGATLRHYNLNGASYVCLDKKRNQDTGAIEGLQFAHFGGKEIVKGRKITIVDDLCDGGRTFTEAAKILKEAGAKEVYLYTTHGIYSKGVNVLFDNSIDRVFNYKCEIDRPLYVVNGKPTFINPEVANGQAT